MGGHPKMVRMIISVRKDQKHRLEALRQQGYTESGFIRALLDREFTNDQSGQEEREVAHVKKTKSKTHFS